MTELGYLMIGTLVLGQIAGWSKNKVKIGRTQALETIMYRMSLLLIILGFILFAGLRTGYNDTGNYLRAFSLVDGDISFSLKQLIIKQYYGFNYFQRLIRHYFNDGQWLIMISSIIYVVIFMRFYMKYSKTLKLTLYSYIVIGTFLFGMAAMKQIIAMSISLISVEFLMKKNYVMFYILTILAYTFHPYILTTCISPLLVDDVWSKRIIRITLLTAVFSFAFTELIGVFLQAADSVGIGGKYSVDTMLDHTINPLRVIVDGIPVLLSWIYRNEINEKGSKLYKFGFNMMTVSWLMTFASLFINPIYMYRTGQYFASFIPVVVPWMLTECMPNKPWKKIFIIGYMVFYTLIFMMDFCGFNFAYDPFRHTSIMTLFK